MPEHEQRAAVVAEAMTWLTTPWMHAARVKGAGVDCAQLPAAVYAATGVIPAIEPTYAEQWGLHRDRELYVEWVLRFGREIGRADLGPGDLVLWKYGRTFSHGAIVVDPPTVIHAWRMARGVTLDNMDQHEELRTRPARFFSLW